MKLIGISGHAGAGKDTAASYLRLIQGAIVFHFAGPLKKACAYAFKVPEHNFNAPELKNEIIPYWNMSPRMIAQFVGTEMFREKLGQDFWVRRMEYEIQELVDWQKTLIVIPDVRFQNEADWVFSKNGHIIHIQRDGADGNVGITNHSSEAGFTVSPTYERRFHVVHNNGSLENLYSQLLPIYRLV